MLFNPFSSNSPQTQSSPTLTAPSTTDVQLSNFGFPKLNFDQNLLKWNLGLPQIPQKTMEIENQSGLIAEPTPQDAIWTDLEGNLRREGQILTPFNAQIQTLQPVIETTSVGPFLPIATTQFSLQKYLESMKTQPVMAPTVDFMEDQRRK
ncbi:unnamed protein product, partial [Mesorhabditis belari]|uniref:Uncharacterized protein n=1 Tax=Mesorhabditis belari TaxID=2138241 RepID=A0AAF3FQL1_9BILA